MDLSSTDYLVEGDDTFSLANLKQEIDLYNNWLIIIIIIIIIITIIIIFTSRSPLDMC